MSLMLLPGVNARQSPDAQMFNAEYDDMPGLQDVSDSESEGESESVRDANEVAMQAIDGSTARATGHSPAFTPSGTHSARAAVPPQTRNRRPRVDDDDDNERDRRHPSQRISSTSNNAESSSSASSTSSPSSSHNPPRTHVNVSAPTASSIPQPPLQRPPSNMQRHVFHTSINLGNGDSDDNPFRLFQHLLPNNIPNPVNNTTNNDNPPTNAPAPEAHGDADSEAPVQEQAQAPPPQPPQDGRNGRRPLFGGVLSFDLGPGGLVFPLPGEANGPPPIPFPMANGPDNAPMNAQQQNGPLPPPLADLLARIGAQVVGNNFAGFGFGGMESQEDPERAQKLVNGLEVVPEGLVRRLERVGGTGGGMGEEQHKGGDSGCAICWDRLLDTDGVGFGPSKTAGESAEEPQDSSSEAETTQPKIVSLPCAHVFHADCLIPWFSRPRQTTCPTCRFNIDPDNLTFVSWHRRQRERREAEAAASDTAEGANPVDAQSTPDAAPGTGAPGAAPAANISNINGDDFLRQLTDFYANTTANQEPSDDQDQQQQGNQLPPMAHLLQGGPAVTVASIPLPFPIPVAVPFGQH